MPEEDPNKFFMVSLIIQQLYREILSVADDMGGKLKNRCIFYADEFGTLPKIESAEIINDNTQLTIFGGFAPNSSSADKLSKDFGSRTVMSGSVSRSKNDPSESLQMIERPLMTSDELKSMPKGQFVVMKTGFFPMKVIPQLFPEWGISLDNEYVSAENGSRRVAYASKNEIVEGIIQKYCPDLLVEPKAENEKNPKAQEKEEKQDVTARKLKKKQGVSDEQT